MDKKVIFAVAGSGKTTHIVKSLSTDKRTLIITYTENNIENLHNKIVEHFGGVWPENIALMSYFKFLYGFCYKPFLADKCKAKGIFYEPSKDKYAKQKSVAYYMTQSRYLYSNRLALLLEKTNVIDEIKDRMRKYFDEFVVDEVQDIAGRDFTFLESLMETEMNMLFVGDFYQHTFDTSRDGNTNATLFDRRDAYEARFKKKGILPDSSTLINSWRCSQSVCNYIKDNLGITISSNRAENTFIEYLTNADHIRSILNDEQIVKLHYQKGASFGKGHKNWGESKGEDHYNDVCVMLNKATAAKRMAGKLMDLPPSTKNKLYVAITRARGNVYLIDE